MYSENRKKAFIIVTVLLSLVAVCFSFWSCDLLFRGLFGGNDVFGDPDNLENMYVDGTDFTPLVKLGTMAANGIWSAAFLMISVMSIMLLLILETGVTAAVWGIFSRCTLKKESSINAGELGSAGKVLKISAAAAAAGVLVIAVIYTILAGNALFLFDLLFCWQCPLFMWLIYLRKLKKSAEVNAG